MSLLSTAGLARASARHPWRILGLWLVILVLAVVSASGLGDALTTSSNFTGKPESAKGADLLADRLRGPQPVTETVIVRSDTKTVDDPAFQQVVAQTAADLRGIPGAVVKSVATYYEARAAGAPQAGQMVSADKRATILPVTLAGTQAEASKQANLYIKTVERHEGNGFQVLTVGDVSVDHAFNAVSANDLTQSERVSLPLTIVVLVIVFGALVAAGVPLILAVVAVITAIGLTALVGRFLDLSFYVVNMITMIGLAVGIDYTLFIVERFREERRHGLAKLDAIEMAGGTATKAVLFSGGTVVFALMGMFLIPLTVFHSLGAGAVLVVIAAVAAVLTLVPALLALLGDRIDWPRRRRYDALAQRQATLDLETYHRGFWGPITRLVMGRPALFVVLAVGLLVALGLPYFDLNRGAAGVETLPPSDVKTAYQILEHDFNVGLLAPVEVVIDAKANDPAVQQGIAKFEAAVAQNPLFGPVSVTPNQAGDLVLLSTPVKEPGNSAAAVDAVKQLRGDVIPATFGAGLATHVYVTGGPAFNADYFGLVDSSTLPVFAFVLGLSFLLLLLAFRSIVVPVKAILMNLLSVGAAYGLLVLVFQKGYLHNRLGFQQTPTIEAWVPIFLFCVLFGLSMDYHVFLLSRIREHYDQTKRNRESVAFGLQATAKIITGAALIMVIVFAGFATGHLVAFQQMGFGMAVAVFLDATVVRSILVPAAMALLGDANWYLPRWLGWLPDLRIEGAADHAPAPVIEATPAD